LGRCGAVAVRDMPITQAANDIQGDAPQLTQRDADPAGRVAIFAVGDIQHPKDAVFDTPMSPQPLAALLECREL